MDRKKFYVEMLDNSLNGGIPSKNIVMLAGSAGTGKTTLAMEFLFNGAASDNDNGMLLTMNEPEVKLKEDFRNFSFYKQEFIDKRKIVVIDLRTVFIGKSKKGKKTILGTPDELLEFIAKQLNQYKPKRLAIDSITALCNYFRDQNAIRQFIFDLGNLLMIFDCTSLLISEVQPLGRQYSNYVVEEFICDGIIFLQHLEKNHRLIKTLQIVKMRGTEHSDELLMLNIQKKGVMLMKLIDNS